MGPGCSSQLLASWLPGLPRPTRHPGPPAAPVPPPADTPADLHAADAARDETTRRRTGPVPGKDRHGQSGPAESSRQASDRGEGRCNDERVAPTGGGKDEREDV